MLLSVCTMSYMKKVRKVLHWNDDNTGIRIFQTLRTFLIVCTGEVMFRAESLPDAFYIYKTVFTQTRINGAAIAAALVPFGNGNQAAASVIIIGILIIAMLIVELRQEKDALAFTKHKYIYAGVLLVLTILFATPGHSNFMYQSF